MALVVAATAALTVGGASSAPAKDPVFKLLYAFTGENDGGEPYAGLIADKAGNLYGTTFAEGVGGFGTAFKLAPDGTLTTLHAFTQNGIDGANPYAGLTLDKAGNLYGTTEEGGPNNYGTIFKIAPDGTEKVLYSFLNITTDGAVPYAGLLKQGGDLYGATVYGGTANDGTIFKVALNGIETVVYSFKGGSDGAGPQGDLIADKAGNLYGTTGLGGASSDGTVFKLSPNGTETVLYSFKGGTDGLAPVDALLLDKAGNLYGTTVEGGADGYGTVFKLATDGTETVLYSFKGAPDAAYPYGNLIADSAGNFYAMTNSGGTGAACGSYGCGAVFKLAPDGTETVLYSFTGGSDGMYPYLGGLITDDANRKGALFGMAREGGARWGTIFRIKE
jgi:uncharacterized repeat protein (TIGR03803 family)